MNRSKIAFAISWLDDRGVVRVSGDDATAFLDNLVTSVRPASRRPDLTPVFSFNSEGLWQGVGAQSAGDPQARLSRWRLVLTKARAEGFI